MFNPDRLELARKRRGITKVALAAKIEVTRRTLYRYEAKGLEPNAKRVEAMSSALGFPTDFFFADSLDEISPDNVSFRSLSRTTARTRDSITARCSFALDLSKWLECKFQLVSPTVPRYEFEVESAELAAEDVRHRWALGIQPVDNVMDTLEGRGVRIFSLGTASPDVDAVSLWNAGIPYIFLNTRGKTPERTRMNAAHELGHLVMHTRARSVHDHNSEREASTFASAFLMPRRGIMTSVRHGATIRELIRIKRVWKVSLSSIVYRLRELNMLTRREYKARFVEIGRNDFRKREPDGMRRGEVSSVLDRMFKTLHDSDTPIWKVARELHVHPEEVSEMLYGLVPRPILAPHASVARSEQEMYGVSPEHMAGPNPLDTTGMDNITDFQSRAASQ